MTLPPRQKVFRIGTRSSALALSQTEKILSGLKKRFPEKGFETRLFQSLGDRDQNTPLETLAKKSAAPSIFADEIEKALREGGIDAAVHSLKDLSVNDDPELCLAALPEREDPRDALVSIKGETLAGLPKGARIGTCSLRRSLQILAQRPDLRVSPVRGTVEARLKIMESGEYEGLILAAAGLRRLGLTGRIAEIFSMDQMLPAPGQGALAVQCRKDDKVFRELLSELDKPVLHACVEAE
ncbi:MAG: hydroxymethylbilane synthase, partial [Spirochaetia bacterium]|nr:hydroxymethylbilane synthase [Spirochaetia bacterium]